MFDTGDMARRDWYLAQSATRGALEITFLMETGWGFKLPSFYNAFSRVRLGKGGLRRTLLGTPGKTWALFTCHVQD